MSDNIANLNYAGIVPFLVGTILPLLMLRRARGAKATSTSGTDSLSDANKETGFPSSKRKLAILYGTVTGTAAEMATALYEDLLHIDTLTVSIHNLRDYNEEELEKVDIVLFICCTWSEGTPPESAVRFCNWLTDLSQDFRVSKNLFSHLSYSAFGLGSRVYGGSLFCKPVKDFVESLDTLSATALLEAAFGDDQTDLDSKFQKWRMTLVSMLAGDNYGTYFKKKDNKSRMKNFKRVIKKAPSTTANTVAAVASEHVPETEEIDEEEEEDKINDKFVCDSSDEEADDAFDQSMQPVSVGDDDHGAVVDVEDMGKSIKQSLEDATSTEVREMVTKLQRKALTKEGYKIIGTHSAVKLCRWTKNQLRGRGGCYKHTFYGITSYQCMEVTPSLACANKCVFCWRHHKNPVGTEWRWKTDPPAMIVETAIQEHQKMVYMMKGVPGVQPERLTDANTVKHCALSLVGEPIMYPRINELLKGLHERAISTFMVTNGQFPECIESLDPVTQLYVSVDAATKDSLKKVDRPLFKDFWERYESSLAALSMKQQRTVYRMTLVKSYNMTEVEGYCELIEKGLPDFIEIKAVTYCGKSDASSLTMQNVPWHEEVCAYAEAIAQRITERGISSVNYSVATEHQHSCCILLAREDKFKPNGVWHTWIDYPKYEQLIKKYYISGGTFTFSGTDYMLPTPEWAIYKSNERGFDPNEQRWRRNQLTGAVVENEYKPSSSGCG